MSMSAPMRKIILGNRNRLLAASSPTGPRAGGGANFLRPARGAGCHRNACASTRSLWNPAFKVIGTEAWSDSDEFIEAGTKVTGICGSGIIELLGEMFLAGILTRDGVIDGALAARTARVRPRGDTFCYLIDDAELEIAVTQEDVRAVQLAKGALYAGARLLMDHMGIERLDRVVLAGAFGSHIDPLYALLLGMVPDCPLERVSSAGNAAGTGARIALVNKKAREEIETLVKRIEKVETAVEPRFQEHFIGAMAIPHAHDDFPNLKSRIELPAAKAAPGPAPHPKTPSQTSRRRQRLARAR